MTFDVVIPTSGRPSLGPLLAALHHSHGPRPRLVFVVPGPDGPAAARNRGWRASQSDWIAFLDDDVIPSHDWLARLAEDLAAAAPGVGGSQGTIEVPLPEGRRPTDWERHVQGLERAEWATADMAYRREALAAAGGFDERFPRAYREDADLALRVEKAGFRLERGRRRVLHPVPPADRWVSVRRERGNADDALMAVLHGRDWGEPPESRRARKRHLVATASLLLGLGALAGGKRRLASGALGSWAALTAALAWRRIDPGPRTRDEIATVLVTTPILAPAATAHLLRGAVRARRLPRRPAAVLFDRDGTLVEDVPYNGDPERVVPRPGAREALARLRAAGVPTAVVSNQSGVARGLLTDGQVDAVNRRVEELLGPLGPWLVCTHGPGDGCECRKPRPGLVLAAARALGVAPGRCAVVGDIGSDLAAARAAGARAVLVPTAKTRDDEVLAAAEVARDLPAAVDLLLGGARG